MDAWKNGEFGNPLAGRSRVNALRTIAQAYLKHSIEDLWEIAQDRATPASTRAKIYIFILEQGFGRAPQSMEVNVTDGLQPSMISTEQLKLMAAGKIKELVFSLIQSGKIEDYIKAHKESVEAGNMEVRPASDQKQLPAN